MGTPRHDILVGTPGDDVIVGGRNVDIIRGRGGNDYICSGSGRDYVEAGWGNDYVLGGVSSDDLSGGLGADILVGSYGFDVLSGGEGPDRLSGDEGDDRLSGLAGDDVLNGGGGSDVLDGAEGADHLNGGGRVDQLSGGPGPDRLEGGTDDDVLKGGADDDLLFGGAGYDRIDAEDGADELDGGTEGDTLVAGPGADTLRGGDGTDQMNGGSDDDVLEGGSGYDQMSGEDGADRLDGGIDWDVLRGGSGRDHLIGGDGGDGLIGGLDDDVLEGGPHNDHLAGDEGHDQLAGGIGDDTELGGPGDDRFLQDETTNGFDSLQGGGGADSTDFSDRSLRVSVTVRDPLSKNDPCNMHNEDDYVDTEEVIGGDGDDTIIGAESNEILVGGTGRDLLNGKEGDDVLRGGDGADALIDESGNNIFDSGTGEDAECVAMATCDVTAPTLTSVEVTPDSLDVSGLPPYDIGRQVTVHLVVEDDLSGVMRAWVPFESPTGARAATYMPYVQCKREPRLVSHLNVSTYLPEFAEEGFWPFEFTVWDQTGLRRDYSNAQLVENGWDSGFMQSGVGDSEAPTVDQVSFTPTTIDTSVEPQVLHARFHATDDLSGVDRDRFSLHFKTPLGNIFQTGPRHLASPPVLVSGTTLDGIWEVDIVIPRWAPPGEWKVDRVYVYDRVGHIDNHYVWESSFAGAVETTGFTQVGAGDSEPPVAQSMQLSTRVIDTSERTVPIEATLHATDNLSGVANASATYRTEDGSARVTVLFYEWHRVSGTAQDGVYKAILEVPRFSMHGRWVLEYISVADALGQGGWLIHPTSGNFDLDFWNGPLPETQVAPV